MVMSDCEYCWNTPCSCGYQYRNMTETHRMDIAASVLGVKVSQLRDVFSDYVPIEHPLKGS